jgi:hypothetical protein
MPPKWEISYFKEGNMNRVVIKDANGTDSVTVYYENKSESFVHILSTALKAHKRLRGKRLMLLLDNIIVYVLRW